jgi:hypothetical protein
MLISITTILVGLGVIFLRWEHDRRIIQLESRLTALSREQKEEQHNYGKYESKLKELMQEFNKWRATDQKEKLSLVIHAQEKAKRDIVEMEDLRAELLRWKEEDEEEKLTLIGSIKAVLGQMDSEEALDAGDWKKFRIPKMGIERNRKATPVRISACGVNIERGGERRSQEMYGELHPVLRNDGLICDNKATDGGASWEVSEERNSVGFRVKNCSKAGNEFKRRGAAEGFF